MQSYICQKQLHLVLRVTGLEILVDLTVRRNRFTKSLKCSIAHGTGKGHERCTTDISMGILGVLVIAAYSNTRVYDYKVNRCKIDYI